MDPTDGMVFAHDRITLGMKGTGMHGWICIKGDMGLGGSLREGFTGFYIGR